MLPAGCRANCTVWLESVVFVEPTMGVAEGIDENRARFGSHRAHRSGLLAFPLNDLTPSIGDGGVQGMTRTRSGASSVIPSAN